MKVKILILGMISFLTASCQTFDEKIFKSSSFFSDNSKLDFGITSQPNLSKIKPKYNEFTVRNANSNIKREENNLRDKYQECNYQYGRFMK